MKIKLAVSQEQYESVRCALESHGITVDDQAQWVLSERKGDPLLVRQGNERHLLPSEDILYIESQGRTVLVHTADGTYQTEERLYQLLSLLDEGDFLRVSNSVIIAKSKVQRIRPTLSMKFLLTMSNGDQVDVTRSYYYIFKESFGI